MATARYFRTTLGVAFILGVMYLAETFVSPRPGALIGGAEVILEAIALYYLMKRPAESGANSRLTTILSLFFAGLIIADTAYSISFYVFSYSQHNPLVAFLTSGFYALAFIMMTLAFVTQMENAKPQLFRNPMLFISFMVTTLIAIKFTIIPFWLSLAGKPIEVFYVVQGLAIIAAYLAVFVSFVSFLGARDIFWTLLSIGMLTLGLGDWAMRIETILGYNPHFGFYEYYWAAGVCFLSLTIIGQKERFRPLALFSFDSILNTYKLGALLTVLLFVILLFTSGATVLSLKLVILALIICVIAAGLISQFLADKHQRFLDITVDLVSDQFLIHSAEAGALQYTLPVELRESFSTIYRKRIDDIKDKEQKEIENKITDAKLNVAAQVAHDIRSPLAALDAALKGAAAMPEEQRVMVRQAVNRIRDIANNLLEKNRQRPGTAPGAASAYASPEAAEPRVQLLSSLIDSVITEKRLQFESKAGVRIDFELTQASYGLFANIQPVEFKRIISNLVNNAIEAVGDKGSVDVSLAHSGENITLSVADNGKGIPPEVIVKLGQKGETHGKAGGSGLGLFHARTTSERWGGGLEITSELGKGTKITINLPKVAAPEWFVPELKLAAGKPVVILDDDTSIHQVWQGRFESARVKENDIAVIHFSEPDKLRGWAAANTAEAENAVYLFDFELLGYKETGLSLAGDIGIGGRTILVTSRYEEPAVLEGCRKLGTRLIPKCLAGFVPLNVSAPAKQGTTTPIVRQAVLLDDDLLVHMTWKMAARTAGVELKVYKTPEELSAGLVELPKDTPIYLDSELGDGVKGEDLAKDLREKSFTDITMATGHTPERFAHLSWLKVLGKEPPFGEG